jgi:predicted transcriptional regulator of viral defense system
MGRKLIDGLASKGKTFTIQEARKLWGTNPNVTRVLLSRLESGGWIERVERGKYIIIPLGSRKGEATLSEFVIASQLVEPCSIAYWSALHHHGLTEQAPGRVFIQTTGRKKKQALEIFGVSYRIIRISPKKYFGTQKQWIEEEEVFFTDAEKTIVDCLDKPQHCGGIIEVAKSLKEGKYDKARLLEYALRIGNSGVVRRLGYLSELLGLKLKVPAPGRKNYLLLDPTMPEKGERISKWGLRVNLDKKVLGELE